jgi:hypothetical protein
MLMLITLAVLALVEWEFFKVVRHLKSQNEVGARLGSSLHVEYETPMVKLVWRMAAPQVRAVVLPFEAGNKRAALEDKARELGISGHAPSSQSW